MKRLTQKQQGFVRDYVKMKNGTKAIIKNYKVTKEKTASAMAVENLGKPSIQNAIDKALVKHNITLDRALKPIDNGLNAMKQDNISGAISEDLNIQLKASDRALKLLGVTQSNSGQTAFVNVINIDKEKYKL
jgi:phage terminase small subunit